MTNIIRKNPLLVLLTVSVIFCASLLIGANFAHSNPNFFLVQNNGIAVTATTTVAYMTPGAATTTYYMNTDLYASKGVNQLEFVLQVIGSSTPFASLTSTTTVNVAFEYAQSNGDCITNPNACDWYSDTTGDIASTTYSGLSITAPKVHTLTLGTNTINGLPVATTSPTRRAIDVPMPTRYVRAVVTLPTFNGAVLNTNGSVWGAFIAKKENN